MTYTHEIERRICIEFCDKYAFARCESCPLYNACCGFENDMSKTTEENERRFEAGLANALAAYDAQH